MVYDLYDEHKAIQLTESLNALHDTSKDIGPYNPDEKLIEDEWMYTVSDEKSQNKPISDETQKPFVEMPVVTTFNAKSESNIAQTKEQLEILPSMQPFYDENTDTVGWLTINNTRIDNIVVQTDNNDFYLDHNFRKERSQPGTLFVDFRCVINDYEENQSHNVIIYGHKQKSGSMFGTLHNYHNNFGFYKENPTFTFSTLYKTYTYKIIAMFSCSATGENVFDYHNYIDLPDDGDYSFNRWIKNVKALSEIAAPVSANPDDYYITLSTCAYDHPDGRFVVIARRVRENESANVDVNNAIKLTH